jgi:glycine/D-amino acid oxidase-like deaminating enzyme
MQRYRTVICGAGIAGVATAYYLGRATDSGSVLLLDKLPPLSLTTSKSGENYRDYWPQQCMTEFSSRSLDLMEALAAEHGNVFSMRQLGYQFVSREPGRDIFGPDAGQATGVTRELDRAAIRTRWPHLSAAIRQVVSIARAGALDVNALGSLLLAEARAAGTAVMRDEIIGLSESASGGFEIRTGQQTLAADHLVLASGPFAAAMAAQLGVHLPVESYAQRKFVIPDPLAIIPRDMPFTICADPLQLDWSDGERELIGDDPAYRWLLQTFPPGLHIKPEGRDRIKLGWAFNRESESPRWDIPVDPDFPNLTIRGASQFIPGLSAYIDNVPTPVTQYAGYYTRSAENWPLIGPLNDNGLFVVSGLSGYGTMAACAAGELCALHIRSEALPAYGRQFHPRRYSDAAVLAEISALDSDGQL